MATATLLWKSYVGWFNSNPSLNVRESLRVYVGFTRSTRALIMQIKIQLRENRHWSFLK